jgi:hypothetical protein
VKGEREHEPQTDALLRKQDAYATTICERKRSRAERCRTETKFVAAEVVRRRVKRAEGVPAGKTGHQRCTSKPEGGESGEENEGFSIHGRGGRVSCGLTFELRRDRRYCAWPAKRIMYQGALRAKCNAVGPRLERGVRPRLRRPWGEWHAMNVDAPTCRRCPLRACRRGKAAVAGGTRCTPRPTPRVPKDTSAYAWTHASLLHEWTAFLMRSSDMLQAYATATGAARKHGRRQVRGGRDEQKVPANAEGHERCRRSHCLQSATGASRCAARLFRSAARFKRCFLRGLTFELRRDRRYCAWPARRMMNQSASRAKRNAVGPRLERGVRPRLRRVGTRGRP